MQDWMEAVIRKNLPVLVADTNCTPKFLSHFSPNNILSECDKSAITNSNLTRHEQNYKFYETIRSRTNSYEVLLLALFETCQSKCFEILMREYFKNGHTALFRACRIRIRSETKLSKEMFGYAFDEAVNTRINFQGKQTTLNSLCRNMSTQQSEIVWKAIDLTTMNEIISSGPNFTIAKEPVSTRDPGFYQEIPFLHTTVQVPKERFLRDTNCLFVFSGVQNYQLSSDINSMDTELSGNIRNLSYQSGVRHILLEHNSHFESILKTSSLNTYLLRYDKNEYTLEFNSNFTKNIQGCVYQDREMSEMQLVDMLDSYNYSTSVCISAPPGMGKTEVLKSIAKQLTLKRDTLVALFTFKDVIQTLNKRQAVNLVVDIYPFIAKWLSQDKLGQIFLRQKLQCKTTNVYFCIDDIDRLEPDEMGVAKRILESFKGCFKRVRAIVTTSYLQPMIESVFGTHSISVKPLSCNMQSQFLTSVLLGQKISKAEASSCAKECLELVERLQMRDALCFPLHCYALGQTIIEDFGKLQEPTTSFRFSIRHQHKIIFLTYKRLLKSKTNSINQETSNITWEIAEKILIENKMELLAKRTLFPSRLACKQEFNEIGKISEHCLIRSELFLRNKEFINQTFPEFIFASYIFRQLTDSSQLHDALHFFVNDLLLVHEITDALLANTPEEELLEFHSFKHARILYFLNYFIQESPFQEKHKQNVSTFVWEIDSEKCLNILSACIYSDFRYIFELCIFLFSGRVNVLPSRFSLHEFNPIRMAAKLVTRDSFKIYWTTLQNLGFDVRHNSDTEVSLTPINISVHYGIYDNFEFLRAFSAGKIKEMHLLHSCVIGSISLRNAEVRRNRIEIMKLLIYDDRNLLNGDIISKNKRTALLQPHSHIDLLECLINEGADVNHLTYSSNSVLHQALLCDKFSETLNLRDFKKLFQLVKYNKFCHFDTPDSLGDTPLHLPIQKMDIDKSLLCMFKAVGADLNRKNLRGENLLFLAVRFGRSLETLNSLINFNINPITNDVYGKTLLHAAVLSGNFVIVDRILRLEVIDIDKQDINGDTAMHYATKINSRDANSIQLCLIRAGGNLLIKNNLGYCPIIDGFLNSDCLSRITHDTIAAIDNSKHPISTLTAGYCLTAIMINSQLSFSFIKSIMFPKLFSCMVNKSQTKVEFLNPDCNSEQDPKSVSCSWDDSLRVLLESFHDDYIKTSFTESGQKSKLGSYTYNEKQFQTENELQKQIYLSELKNSELCCKLLKNNCLVEFFSFRQELRSICSPSTYKFRKIPSDMNTIFDDKSQSFVYLTKNPKLLISRLQDCLGKQMVIYSSLKNDASVLTSVCNKLDVLVVNVGTNKDIFEKHSQFLSIYHKVIYVATQGMEYHIPQNVPSFKDVISWNDITPLFQNEIMLKLPKLTIMIDSANFSSKEYELLISNHISDLVSYRYLTLEIMCQLLQNKYLDILYHCEEMTQCPTENRKTILLSLAIVALITMFPDLANKNDIFAHFDTANKMYGKQCVCLWFNVLRIDLKHFVERGLLLEKCIQQSEILKYRFKLEWESCAFVGRALAFNIFGSGTEYGKLYSRCFTVESSPIEIPIWYNILNSNGIRQNLSCFKFKYPVLMYFYNTFFKDPSVFLQVVNDDQVKPFIYACIRVDLCLLLKVLFETKAEWFCDEHLVFIAFARSNLNTIKQVVDYFESTTNTKVNTLSLKKKFEITPLHVAINRGNLEVVDYMLNVLQFKNLLTEMDSSSLFRYCVSYTVDLTETEVKSREEIFELLLTNFRRNSQKTILKNILVEVANVHVELIKFLLRNGANAWDTDRCSGSNIAHLAPKYLKADAYLELVRFLISEGHGQLFKMRNCSEDSAIRCALKDLKTKDPDDSDENDICQILELLHKHASVRFTIRNYCHKTILDCAKDEQRSSKVVNTIIKLS